MQRAITSGDRQTFRKAREVIMSRDRGVLELLDFKVLNFLMHRTIPFLQSRSVHRLPVKDMLLYLGHTSTQRLQESLSRLGKANVEIDYRDEAGDEHHAVIHYLSFDISRTENGYIVFAFDPLLMQMLSDPDIYGTLNINTFQKFRSPHSMKLYEVLSLYVKRRIPVWDVSIDELRDILGVDGSYAKRLDNFRTRVIEASVAEINEVADFSVRVDYVRGGRGGRILRCKFETSLKTSVDMLATPKTGVEPASRHNRGFRDRFTVDLIDGRTDDERGDTAVLRPETLAAARQIMREEDDLQGLEEAWRLDMKERRVIDPDQSFLQWLNLRNERSESPELEEIDEDTIAALLENFQ